MADLALASNRQIALPPAQWAHDIRNLLRTIGLHLDSLGRLSGPQGAKSADAMHTLIARAAVMCTEAVTFAEGETGRALNEFPLSRTVYLYAVAGRPRGGPATTLMKQLNSADWAPYAS
jgi:hypothetical protein